MKKWLFAILFVSALTLGACGGGNDGANDNTSSDSNTTETASGEDIFKENNCTSCHGADLTGGAGPDLTEVGSRLSADEISGVIENGRGDMPPQNVSAEDREVLANWLADKK